MKIQKSRQDIALTRSNKPVFIPNDLKVKGNGQEIPEKWYLIFLMNDSCVKTMEIYREKVKQDWIKKHTSSVNE